MIPVTTFAGKTVAVFGLGGSGIATAHALVAGGATIAAWDDGEPGRAAAEKAGIPLVDLNTADWTKFAALVLAPGVPLTHPEPHWSVRKAIAAKIEIIGDIELFCRERNAHCPDAAFIAITGTNGKSTTTSLVAHILRNAGRDAQMGGNIGVPILALEPPAKDRIYVIEMSSFQIDLTPSLNPTVGVLLNITPDHIDRHGTFKAYGDVKRILVECADYAVIGASPYCDVIAQNLATPNMRISDPTRDGIYASEGKVWETQSGLLSLVADLRGVGALRGAHNGENTAAAYAVLKKFGLSLDEIQSGMRTYPGLAHRLEEIGRIGDVAFINDSKATNADSTEKALLSFPDGVYWILGGKPKEGGIEPLVPLFPAVMKAYLIGAASDAFAKTLEGLVPYERCVTLDAAVAAAARDAAAYRNRTGATPTPNPSPQGGGESPNFSLPPVGRAGVGVGQCQPVVLLSPACASYDQFKSFEHRGDTFRTLVTALPGFTPRGKA